MPFGVGRSIPTLTSRIFTFFKWCGIALLLSTVYPDVSKAQFITEDFALHDVGRVQQFINNSGSFNARGLIYIPDLLNTEFPKGSDIEHISSGGWWIGGITPQGDTLVTTTHIPFLSANREFNGYSDHPDDGVFRFESNRTHHNEFNPPPDYFYQSYEPFSHQDLLTRYNDYNPSARQNANHDPLYVDVYQISYSWGYSPNPANLPPHTPELRHGNSLHPLDNVIVVNYRVTPTQFPLEDVFIASYFAPVIERVTDGSDEAGGVDRIRYNQEQKQVITHDSNLPGRSGGSAIGTQILPDTNAQSLTWSWHASSGGNLGLYNDADRYKAMSSGNIDDHPADTSTTRPYLHAMGPFDIAVGDTLQFRIALSLGSDAQTVRRYGSLLRKLHEQGFELPEPPPSPEISVETEDNKAIIQWSDEVETYTDPHRLDGAEKPFEGYRVYKTTGDRHRNPDWTLLAQYDRPNNRLSPNTGLQYEFVDRNLSSYQEYHYAVTAYTREDTVLGFPPLESEITSTNSWTIIADTEPRQNLDSVSVVPNPYRGDLDYHRGDNPWEKPPAVREVWLPADRRLLFINLPARATINIFTLSGRKVKSLQHHDENKGIKGWNLTNKEGEQVSSGIYLYTVENQENGDTKTGKFVIIL